MKIKNAFKVFALSAIAVLFAVLSASDYLSDAFAGTDDENAENEAAARIIVLRHGFLSASDIELYKKIKTC